MIELAEIENNELHKAHQMHRKGFMPTFLNIMINLILFLCPLQNLENAITVHELLCFGLSTMETGWDKYG